DRRRRCTCTRRRGWGSCTRRRPAGPSTPSSTPCTTTPPSPTCTSTPPTTVSAPWRGTGRSAGTPPRHGTSRAASANRPAARPRRARSRRCSFPVDTGLRGPPGGGGGGNTIRAEIDDELSVVVANLIERSQPEREAGHHAVPEREFHLLEQLGIGQGPERLLSRLQRLLQQTDDFRLRHGLVRVLRLALGPLCAVDEA